MTLPELHPRSITFLISCAVGVLAIGLLGLYPNHLALKEMDSEIETLDLRIQEQQTLSPVLKKLIVKAKPANTMGLTTPLKQTAIRMGVDEITKLLNELADRSQLEIEQVTPDESSLAQESRYLIMNLAAKGDYFNFRNLLIELGKLPFLNDINNFEIIVGNNVKQLKLKLVFLQEK
jgi:Tfp pilus assembly protein PilO